MNFGIAVASGTFKGVFGHGVLSTFEAEGILASSYSTVSSSVLSGGFAAIGQANAIGVDYWIEVAGSNKSMSEIVLESIEKYGPILREKLFHPNTPRFLIGTSRVANQEAADLVQSPQAKRLGKKLLLEAARQNSSWVKQNLEIQIYDSKDPQKKDLLLKDDNFDEVAYASTRMLHAWEIPAQIQGQAYVDGSYTSSCLSKELADIGCDVIAAIGTEPGTFYRDLAKTQEIDKDINIQNTKLVLIQPPFDLATLGVDFTKASEEGLSQSYQLGIETGQSFLTELNKLGI